MKQIPVEQLRSFAESVLRARNVPQDGAAIVVDCLLYANLSGVDSHGIMRLAHYARRLSNGTIKARPEIRYERTRPAILHVDGGDGLGHVITSHAVERAIPICREQGTVSVSIGSSSHCGMLGYYLRDITAAGLVGMVTTHTDVRIVPAGARVPFSGTNPIAWGFPTSGEPFVLDFATTSVAWGKIALAQMESRPIPSDWGVDENGDPTTDPAKVVGMHAIAGYKGSGLAMVIDLLSSMFSGMPFGPNINRMYDDMNAPRKLGHFVTLWDPAAFAPAGDLRARMDRYIAELHALPRVDPDKPIYYPGEPEAIRRAERSRIGVPLEDGVIAELGELGRSLGLDTTFLGGAA